MVCDLIARSTDTKISDCSGWLSLIIIIIECRFCTKIYSVGTEERDS